MSFQRRRQLTEEQTRLYAAGMNAARRGESQPKERLPPEQYKIWCWGWRRIGRTLHTNSERMRSTNHLTKVEGMQVIHTQVESFDDAVRLIAIQQRAKKSRDTARAKPQNWRQELGMHKGRQNSPIGRALTQEQADRISEFERHIVKRVVTAIGELKLSVEEMSVVSAMTRVKFPAVNPKSLMDVIETLSHLIKRDVPTYDIQRAPLHKPIPRCIECGTELDPKSELEYCRHCDPATGHQQVAAKLLREHHARLAGIRHEVNEVEKLTYKISRRVVDHEYQGHGGHSGEAAGSVEAGGGKEDVLVGSEASHQPGTGSTGDGES